MGPEYSPASRPASGQDSAANSKEPALLRFDDSSAVKPGKDINTKITALDTDLAHMRAELGAINNSVEEGLDRLSDTDTDLTAKVSETYKRLGEIDNAYKSLLEISSRIDTDIQKLNGDVSTVAEQSASGIKHLQQSTIVQSNELSIKNQQVASRVAQLVETSKLSNDLLAQKIQSTTGAMLQIEKKVVAEIELLSSMTKEKADLMGNAVDSNKAKILKLQSVDEAIIRRATTLEISSAELTVTSRHLDSSVRQLESSSNLLSHSIASLKNRTVALEALTRRHGTLIDGLQTVSSEFAEKLAALTDRERKHFNMLCTGGLLLIVVVVMTYFIQQNQFGIVDSRFIGLQEAQTESAITVNGSLAVLESKIDRVNAALQDEIQKKVSQVEANVQTVKDQVGSVDARLSQSSPFSHIGDDNIIHSAQWIAELPEENLTVQLAYTDNKNTLYETAQRYNHYLQETLSYFEVNDNGSIKYVLLSGNYTSQKQAIAAIDSMPRYIDMQQPLVRRLAAIQQYIAQ